MTDYYEDSISPSNTKMAVTSDTFEEPLSDSVRTLLQDDMFNQDNNKFTDENEISAEYQSCMTLFVTGQIKECLETMFENNLLFEDILNDDKTVYDLYLSACNELTNFQELGVTLRHTIRNTFTGDTKNDVGLNHYMNVSIDEQIEFWNKYFKNCINTLKIRNNNDIVYSMELALKQVIIQYSNQLSSMGKPAIAPSIISYLTELVRMYIFDIEIKTIGNKKNRKLYDSLCSSVPHLSEILSSSNGVSGQSYEDKLLAQLRNEKDLSRITKNSGPADTTDQDATMIPELQKNESTITEERKGSANIKDSILSYIKQIKYAKQILSNKHLQNIINHITKMDSSSIGITLAVTFLIIARYNRRRISYILRNFGLILKRLLPYIIEFIRILTST